MDIIFRFREIFRRNLEGDLFLPDFWPYYLAPLFWPLLLVLSFILIWSALNLSPSHVRILDYIAGERVLLQNLSTEINLLSKKTAPSNKDESAPKNESDIDSLISSAEQHVLLTSLFVQNFPSNELILKTYIHKLSNTLQFKLSQEWNDLSLDRRYELSEIWNQISLDLGYWELRLLTPDGNLIGRPALAGDGMILFDPDQIA